MNHVTFMTFQHSTFTIPLHLYVFFHILFLSMITLQTKWLMIKGLTQGWTLLLHSCRTSVVWLTDWLAGWQTDCGKIWTGLLWGKAGKNLSCLLRWHGNTRGKRNKGGREKRQTENVRGLEISLYALCGSIHACISYGLNSMSACVICCFHCVVSQLPSALYLCVQTQIWCCVHWLGHGSWPESFSTGYGLAYDCSGKNYPHSSPICNFQRPGSFAYCTLY